MGADPATDAFGASAPATDNKAEKLGGMQAFTVGGADAGFVFDAMRRGRPGQAWKARP